MFSVQVFAIAALFAIYGIGSGVITAYIPVLARELRLSPFELSLGISGCLIGSTIASAVMGRLSIAPAFLARPLAIPSALAMIPVAFLSGGLLLVWAILYGMLRGSFSTALNARAVTLQEHRDRPILPACHGSYSFGVLAGAVVGTLCVGETLSPAVSFCLVCALMLPVSAYACAQLPYMPARPTLLAETKSSAATYSSALVMLCVASFCGALTESAVSNWSGIYLSSIVHARMEIVGYGVIGFSCAMACMRFSGGHMIALLGKRPVLFGGAAIAALSLLVVILFPFPVPVIAGFFGVGLGMANITPILYGFAGKVTALQGSGVAHTSTAGGIGALVGPSVIGAAATYGDLRLGLTIVACACLIVFAVALFSRNIARLA